MQKVGDVIFTGSKSKEAFGSSFAQRLVDPDAGWTSTGYEHAALVISDYVVLEAVPAGEVLDPEAAEGLTGMYELGEWTGAPLRAGVRLAPVADLVVPASGLLVLRPPASGETAHENLSPYSPAVAELLGSSYSLDAIKEALRKQLGMLGEAADWFNWASPPRDYVSRLGLDGASRADLARLLPEFQIPEVARTYFCSQLVEDFLVRSGLLATDAGARAGLTTPTGLAVRLRNAGWRDVTEAYTAGISEAGFPGGSAGAHAASYLSALALAEMGMHQRAAEITVDAYAATIDKVNRNLEGLIAHLQSKGPDDTQG